MKIEQIRTLTTLALTLIALGATGQSFSDKTNAIKLNFKQPATPTAIPAIEWITPRIERSNSTEDRVTIEAKVRSLEPLKSLRFEVTSGGETHGRDIALSEGETTKVIRQPLTLLPGDNILKLIAVNGKGGQVSSVRSILAGKDAIAEAIDINRKDYALLIATDNYENWGDLNNPVNDAKTIQSLLQEKYGFQTELMENPSLEEINNKLYEYNTKRFNPQDQLFVFIAGHGYFDETLGEGYLVATNSLKNDLGKSTYLSHLILRNRLNNIKCEHIFLTMDVCFGGTFDPAMTKVRAEEAMDETIDRDYLVRKLTKRTRKYLTSGSKEYVPDGTPGKHSPFAEKFILALKEVGGGSGRILSTIELRPYFLRLATEPRFAGFGDDDPASDFVFVEKQ